MRTASIRHFRWLPLALGTAALALACTAEVPGEGVDNDDPRAVLAGQFNSDVLPLMQQACASCHGGSMQFIDYLVPNDEYPTVYERVISWPAMVNTEDPGQSRIVTKGAHDGPAWRPEQLNLINPWLEAEANFGSSGEEIDTTAVVPVSGDNSYDLGELGIAEASGCRIAFLYDFSAPIVYITNLRIIGDADGCILEEPVVAVVTDPDSTGNETTWYDPNHKFQGVTVDVGPSQEVLIGGGSVIVSWVPGDQLQGTVKLKFRFFGAQATGTGGGGEGGGGAQLVDLFYDTIVNGDCNMANGTANGTPCLNCHSGGGAAGGLDMSDFGSTDPDARQQLANQFFIRSNRADPDGTHDWIAKITDAAITHGGGKNAALGAACDPPNDAWISMEVTQ